MYYKTQTWEKAFSNADLPAPTYVDDAFLYVPVSNAMPTEMGVFVVATIITEEIAADAYSIKEGIVVQPVDTFMVFLWCNEPGGYTLFHVDA